MREQVRKLKEEKGITYTFMAKKSRIPYSTLRNYLYGINKELSATNERKLKDFLYEANLKGVY